MMRLNPQSGDNSLETAVLSLRFPHLQIVTLDSGSSKTAILIVHGARSRDSSSDYSTPVVLRIRLASRRRSDSTFVCHVSEARAKKIAIHQKSFRLRRLSSALVLAASIPTMKVTMLGVLLSSSAAAAFGPKATFSRAFSRSTAALMANPKGKIPMVTSIRPSL